MRLHGHDMITHSNIIYEDFIMKNLFRALTIVTTLSLFFGTSVLGQSGDDSDFVITRENADQTVRLGGLGLGFINDIQWLADNHTLVLANSLEGVQLYDLDTPDEAPYSLSEEFGGAFAVDVSPTGDLIAAGGQQGVIGVWNLRDDTEIYLTDQKSASILDVSFNHDGTLLATVTSLRKALVWDITTKQSQKLLEIEEGVLRSVKFHPTSNKVLIQEWDKIHVVDLDSDDNPVVIRTGGTWSSFSFLHDVEEIATGDGNKLFFWNISTGQRNRILDSNDQRMHLTQIDASTSGLLAAAIDTAWVGEVRKNIQIWDELTGRVVANLQDHDAQVTNVVFSRNGEFLASTSHDGTVRIWDTVNFRGQIVLSEYIAYGDISYSTDGQMLVAAASDYTVRVYDIAAGVEVSVLRGHRQQVYSVDYRTQAPQIISSSRDGTVRLWNISSRTSFNIYNRPRDLPGETIFFSDGNYLVFSASDSVIIWNVTGGYIQNTYSGSNYGTWGVAVSPDNQLLAILMYGGLQIRDLETSMLLSSIGNNNTSDMTWTAADRLIVASNANGKLDVYMSDGSLFEEMALEETHVNVRRGEIALSPTEDILIVGATYLVELWDIKAGELITYVDTAGLIGAVDINSRGDQFATSGSSNAVSGLTIELWGLPGSWQHQPSRYVYETGIQSADAPTCQIRSRASNNLRSGPTTDDTVVDIFPTNYVAFADGQFEDEFGYTWYRFMDGKWAREDVINVPPACEVLEVLVANDVRN